MVSAVSSARYPKSDRLLDETLDLRRRQANWSQDSGSRRALMELLSRANAGELDALVMGALDHQGHIHFYLTGEAYENMLIASGISNRLCLAIGELRFEEERS